MPVSLIRMVPLTSEVPINGTGFLMPVREGNSWINYSFRFKKCQKNRENYSSILKNGSRLSVVSNSSMDITLSNEREVKDMVLKQVNMLKGHLETSKSNMEQLNEAYGRCRQLCEEYSRTFYLGTLVMDPERQRAIWAIYAWCRRTDDLVDGPNASNTSPLDLDQWEERLEDIFRGKPHDILDAALSDTVSKFHIDIQPFRDMIEGMRMDLTKSRYKNFDELYLYCYHVDATVGLMVLPVLGIAPESQATTESVSNSLLKLGLAIQMANILRDVGEDARRGRVYLPQDELAQAGLSDDDVFAGKVTDKWRKFMKKQIHRARKFFDDAEKGIPELNSASRWPTWASLLFCRKILDEIEANDYDNFTRCANVSKTKKFCILPIAYAKSILPSSFRNS